MGGCGECRGCGGGEGVEGVGVPKERESNIAGSDLESKVIPVILVRKVFILLRGALQMGIRGSTVEANSAASSRPGKRSGKERKIQGLK